MRTGSSTRSCPSLRANCVCVWRQQLSTVHWGVLLPFGSCFLASLGATLQRRRQAKCRRNWAARQPKISRSPFARCIGGPLIWAPPEWQSSVCRRLLLLFCRVLRPQSGRWRPPVATLVADNQPRGVGRVARGRRASCGRRVGPPSGRRKLGGARRGTVLGADRAQCAMYSIQCAAHSLQRTVCGIQSAAHTNRSSGPSFCAPAASVCCQRAAQTNCTVKEHGKSALPNWLRPALAPFGAFFNFNFLTLVRHTRARSSANSPPLRRGESQSSAAPI